VDEDHEVDVDQSLHRPLLPAGKIALPMRVGVAFQKLVPRVGVVAWRRCKARCVDHILHRLPRNVNAHLPQLLQDLGVAEAGLFADPKDRVVNAFLNLWSSRSLLGGHLHRHRRVILHLPNPTPKGGIRDDRHHVLDLAAQVLACLTQPGSFTIVRRDAAR